MNGKKAKLNRKLAGVDSKQPNTSYTALENTRKLRNRYHPTALNDEGLPIGQFETCTLVLNKCSRQLYKIMKKTYTDFQRGNKRTSYLPANA